MTLDAAGTRDPDGNALSLDWSFYPEAGSGIPGQPVVAPRPRPATPPAGAPGAGGIPSAPAGGPREAPVRVVVENPRSWRAVVVPKVAGIAHVVLTVEDDGTPKLTSYRRVILNIKPAARSGTTRTRTKSVSLRSGPLQRTLLKWFVLCVSGLRDDVRRRLAPDGVPAHDYHLRQFGV